MSDASEEQASHGTWIMGFAASALLPHLVDD
jgi:hypothetical protein